MCAYSVVFEHAGVKQDEGDNHVDHDLIDAICAEGDSGGRARALKMIMVFPELIRFKPKKRVE